MGDFQIGATEMAFSTPIRSIESGFWRILERAQALVEILGVIKARVLETIF